MKHIRRHIARAVASCLCTLLLLPQAVLAEPQEVVLDGSSKTFTHCELNTLKLEEADGGIALHGVVWTSHATQFNIIMATIQVTADFYVGGELAGTSDDVANINIPEMSSSQFTLNWATSTKMDEITKVIVHVVGENVTNAPTEEVTNG